MEQDQLGFFDFINLLHVDDKYKNGEEEYYHGFSIREDGIWMLPPSHDIHKSTHRVSYQRAVKSVTRPIPQPLPPLNEAERSELLKLVKEREGVSADEVIGQYSAERAARLKSDWPTETLRCYDVARDPDGNAIIASKPLEDFYKGFDVHTIEKVPVLPFPCTALQLFEFLEKTGLDGMLDPDDLAKLKLAAHPLMEGPLKHIAAELDIPDGTLKELISKKDAPIKKKSRGVYTCDRGIFAPWYERYKDEVKSKQIKLGKERGMENAKNSPLFDAD